MVAWNLISTYRIFKFLKMDFHIFLKYFIQHCFISDSIVSEDAGIETCCHFGIDSQTL